jgi:hypothetical protein
MTNAEKIRAAMMAQNFDGVSPGIGAQGNDVATFNFQVANAAASGTQFFELFAPNRSALEVQRTDFGTYTGAFAFATGNATMTYGGDAVTLSSLDPNIPYRQFFNALRTNVYRVTKMRVQTTTANQQAFGIQSRYYNGLGGVLDNNLGSQTTWKAPTNNQNLIVDIDLNIRLDQNTAIWGRILPAETIIISLFVQNWFLPNQG